MRTGSYTNALFKGQPGQRVRLVQLRRQHAPDGDGCPAGRPQGGAGRQAALGRGGAGLAGQAAAHRQGSVPQHAGAACWRWSTACCPGPRATPDAHVAAGGRWPRPRPARWSTRWADRRPRRHARARAAVMTFGPSGPAECHPARRLTAFQRALTSELGRERVTATGLTGLAARNAGRPVAGGSAGGADAPGTASLPGGAAAAARPRGAGPGDRLTGAVGPDAERGLRGEVVAHTAAAGGALVASAAGHPPPGGRTGHATLHAAGVAAEASTHQARSVATGGGGRAAQLTGAAAPLTDPFAARSAETGQSGFGAALSWTARGARPSAFHAGAGGSEAAGAACRVGLRAAGLQPGARLLLRATWFPHPPAATATRLAHAKRGHVHGAGVAGGVASSGQTAVAARTSGTRTAWLARPSALSADVPLRAEEPLDAGLGVAALGATRLARSTAGAATAGLAGLSGLVTVGG